MEDRRAGEGGGSGRGRARSVTRRWWGRGGRRGRSPARSRPWVWCRRSPGGSAGVDRRWARRGEPGGRRSPARGQAPTPRPGPRPAAARRWRTVRTSGFRLRRDAVSRAPPAAGRRAVRPARRRVRRPWGAGAVARRPRRRPPPPLRARRSARAAARVEPGLRRPLSPSAPKIATGERRRRPGRSAAQEVSIGAQVGPSPAAPATRCRTAASGRRVHGPAATGAVAVASTSRL